MTSTMVNKKEELSQILESSVNTYKVLFFLFSEPLNEELYDQVKNSGMMIGLSEVFEEGQILEDYFETLEVANFDELAEEYRRLFIGPNMINAPLWESFYTDEKNLLFSKSTFQIRDLLLKSGREYILKNNEPEDHLLVELEFAIYLINENLRTYEETGEFNKTLLEDHLNLLTNHLCVWVPQLGERIRKHSTTPLYVGSSYFLESFLKFDEETVRELLELL